MTIKLKKNDNIYVIELDGELDLYNAYKVKTLYAKNFAGEFIPKEYR